MDLAPSNSSARIGSGPYEHHAAQHQEAGYHSDPDKSGVHDWVLQEVGPQESSRSPT